MLLLVYSILYQISCRALDNKWKEKGELIGQLETQVRQVKQTFDDKEKRLTEERDKALKAERWVSKFYPTLRMYVISLIVLSSTLACTLRLFVDAFFLQPDKGSRVSVIFSRESENRFLQ